jgi:O-methyltransferase involved in polyketide biosynthesis
MHDKKPSSPDSVDAIRAFSAPQSRLLLNYVDRGRIEKPLTAFRLARWAGEPPCFGWDPAELPAWLRERGFAVLSDYADRAMAATYFPPALAQDFPDRGGHVALCAPSVPAVLR